MGAGLAEAPPSQRLSEPARGSTARFQIVGRLAEGGMAELLLARAHGLQGFQKIVVMKRIRRELAADPDLTRMFFDEARLAAALDHANVVHVYDIGRAGDDYFFTMEYIHGESVRDIIAAARKDPCGLPLSHALRIASGIAAGLHHAHERIGFDGRPLGIIHRDVSPSNVIVSYEGGVKVVDFGIARAALKAGKRPYMAPEAHQGGALDRRADIWALGVVVYELVALRHPWAQRSGEALVDAIVEGAEVEPLPGEGDAVREIERIAARAMSVAPDDRYPTARAMLSDLQDVVRTHPDLAATPDELGEWLDDLLGPRPLPWQGKLTVRETVEVTQTVLPTAVLPATRVDAGQGAGRWRWGVVALLGAGIVGLAWTQSKATDAGEAEAPAPATAAHADAPIAREVEVPAAADEPSTVRDAGAPAVAGGSAEPAPVDATPDDRGDAPEPRDGETPDAAEPAPDPAPAAPTRPKKAKSPPRAKKAAKPRPRESSAEAKDIDPNALFPF